ncbi:MAG: DUF2066 domain-containing protein [Rhizobiales bacterium]|nr:DUF2066 domain-containing protein [Hyphomicrobiales bacterium]
MTEAMTVLHPWRALLAALLFAGVGIFEAMAAGPVETNIFAVQGVPIDVTSTDATTAKNQALMDVQVKAFFILIERLGSAEIAQGLTELKPDEIAAYLKSLSIEQENSSPGRYIGTFTVRFLPGKIQRLLEGYGIRVPTRQASPIIVLPVYREPSGSKLWEDNLWRKAWLDLRAEQSLVPIIVPIGDLEDTETLTEEDALNGDPIKLEAIRRRYGASSLVVAVAEPAEGGGIHAVMSGNTALGKVTFDKTYISEPASLEQSAALATQRFHAVMMEKYKENEAQAASVDPNAPLSIAVAVPFGSPTEWNGIRSRILSTPNVIGVDVSTLSADGAVIRLMYTDNLPVLQDNMMRTGLALSQIGQSWVIQPM